MILWKGTMAIVTDALLMSVDHRKKNVHPLSLLLLLIAPSAKGKESYVF
jgi:hypothetical protein